MRRAARQLPLPVDLPTLSRLRLRKASAFSETDAETEETTEASEALSESEESTENAVSLSENKKSKTLVTVICLVSAFIVLAGGVCFIVFYVKKRRKKRRKRKIC